MKIIADCSNGMQVCGSGSRYTILDQCHRLIHGVRMNDSPGIEEALLYAVADQLGQSTDELHKEAQCHIQQAIRALNLSTTQRQLVAMKAIGRPSV
ncbi:MULTISPECIES: hypothetical protein [Shewanella]|uniref:hypothetical protein n=1 Tax=Shewanella TaxID=22 RepID=UPI001AAF8777|nr:hypothetical protein [Shewanella algae]MBO2580237.1 hypothetical protein [Shewanella algae]HDS1207824.1 hypothetical protein [Shewanella algae]